MPLTLHVLNRCTLRVHWSPHSLCTTSLYSDLSYDQKDVSPRVCIQAHWGDV